MLFFRKFKNTGISGWSGKGQHTTTFAEMFDLPFGGRIIDTPICEFVCRYFQTGRHIIFRNGG
jgi:hypothetical protein